MSGLTFSQPNNDIWGADWYEPFPGELVAGTGALTAQIVHLYRAPRLGLPRHGFGRSSLWNGATVAGTVDVGWYWLDGSTLRLLTSSGAITLSGANARQDVAYLSTLAPTPDVVLYHAVLASNATHLFIRASNTQAAAAGSKAMAKAVAQDTLPTTITGHSATAVVPWFMARP